MAAPQTRVTNLCIAPLRWQLRRGFTSSSCHKKNGPLAVFPKTSSSELDGIINSFREKVFFPNHVSKFDREMIYRPSKQIYLTGEEAVTARVHVMPSTTGKKQSKVQRDESVKKDKPEAKKLSRATAPAIYPQKKAPLPKETFVMSPINIVTDMPKLRPNYRRMMQLMSAPADFAIVPEFLRELNLTNMKITPEMLAGTIRRAAELDRLDIIMQTFESSDNIGLRVNHPQIVTQLMQAIVRHAANGHWRQDRLDKSLTYSDSVLRMLQDPQHRVPDVTGLAVNAFTLPQVWGASMALTAIRQLRYGPRDTLPHRYDLSTLAQGFLERLDLSQVGDESMNGAKQNMWLADWASAIHGAKYTIQALGESDPSAMKLQLAHPVLFEAALQAAGKVAEAFPGANQEKLGLKMTQMMETALELESSPVAPMDAPLADQHDGDTVVASEPAEGGESVNPAGTEETSLDGSVTHQDRKDTV